MSSPIWRDVAEWNYALFPAPKAPNTAVGTMIASIFSRADVKIDVAHKTKVAPSLLHLYLFRCFEFTDTHRHKPPGSFYDQTMYKRTWRFFLDRYFYLLLFRNF